MFGYFFDYQYSGAMWLYLAIFIVSSILGFLSQKRKKNGDYIFLWFPFTILFFFLWYFFALNDVGADTSQYRMLYETTDSEYNWAVLEPGYRVVNVFFNKFTKSGVYGLACIRSLQLILVFCSFYILRNKISIGYAVMAYVAFIYFESFNLIRMCLALSGSMVSFALMYRKRTWISLIVAVLMITIHRSAFIFASALFAYYFFYVNSITKNMKLIKSVVVAILGLLPIIGAYLMKMVLGSGLFTDRFDDYVSDGMSFGIMVYLYYIPLFAIIYKAYKEKSYVYDRQWYFLNFVFAGLGFVIAIMGYGMGMLTRANVFFIMPFAFYLGYYDHFMRKSKQNVQPYIVFFVIYWFFRFVINTSGVMGSSELYNFKLII